MTSPVVKIEGVFSSVLRSRKSACLRGLRQGTEVSVEITKRATRADVRRAGLGDGLANSIRGNTYPKTGLAYEPTGVVHSNSPKIIAGQADGGTITARSADSLKIPISNGPADALKLAVGQTVDEALRAKYGRRNIVQLNRSGKNPLLGIRMRYAKAKLFQSYRDTPAPTISARSREKGLTADDVVVTVPAFTLVKNVRLKKRLQTREIFARAGRDHPARVSSFMRQRLKLSEKETGR